MTRIRGQLVLTSVAVALAAALVGAQPASAEEKTPITILVSPQLWLSMFPSGFQRPSTQEGFSDADVESDKAISPQSGAQIALRYGQWTFAVSELYAAYRIRETQRSLVAGADKVQVKDISRVDVDLTGSYTFLDVIKNVLDVSLGVGLKYVYFDQDITLVSPVGNVFTATGTVEREVTDNIFGVTFPIGLNLPLQEHLVLPIGVNPFIGYDVRRFNRGRSSSLTAYGGTLDAGLRYIFSNGASLYAGYRGQGFTNSQDAIGAHGPFFSISFPFNIR